MDQGWIRAGRIQGDVLGPFPGSGMAIEGRHRPPKWPKIAINGPFVAMWASEKVPGWSNMAYDSFSVEPII